MKEKNYHKIIVQISFLDSNKAILTWVQLGMQWGGVGTGFTFPIPIPYSCILTRYPTHIQRGWEIESHPRPQWVRVFPPHPRTRNEQFFLIKKKVFLSLNGNVGTHYPTICVQQKKKTCQHKAKVNIKVLN